MKTQQKIPCDRCGHAVLWQGVLASGAPMSFCGHHKNEHAAKLKADGVALLPVNSEPVKSEFCNRCVHEGVRHDGLCDGGYWADRAL